MQRNFFRSDPDLIFCGGSDPGELDPDPQSLAEGGEKFNYRVASKQRAARIKQCWFFTSVQPV